MPTGATSDAAAYRVADADLVAAPAAHAKSFDAAAYRVADADLVAAPAAHAEAPDAVLAADTAGDAGADAEDPPGSALRGAS